MGALLHTLRLAAVWSAEQTVVMCVITIDGAGLAALRLRCIANAVLNNMSSLHHVGTLLSHTP
jgi:hypothetical protein